MTQRRIDGDEGGQTAVLRSQSVGDPGAHAGTDKGVGSGVQFEQRPAVRLVGAVNRLQEAEVVGARPHLRKQVADHRAALSIGTELPRRFPQVGGFGKLDARLGEGKRLARVTDQRGLVVEGIHMRRPAVHAEEDDALGPRTEHRCGHGRGKRGKRGRRRGGVPSAPRSAQQAEERELSEASAALTQHLAAGHRGWKVVGHPGSGFVAAGRLTRGRGIHWRPAGTGTGRPRRFVPVPQWRSLGRAPENAGRG